MVTMVFRLILCSVALAIPLGLPFAVYADPPVAAVPKTGQSTPYLTGDDGSLQKGVTVANRFTDNGTGTVTDRLTGLVWLKNASCFGMQNWTTAITSATTLANGQCGLSDGSLTGEWRLPNLNELKSLIDYGYSPSLPAGHAFSGVQSDYYWSSSTTVFSTSYAWYVHLSVGYVYYNHKSNTGTVWPVRGGQ